MDNISLLNPLLDNEFLQKLFKEQRRVIQIKIISLDLDDYPIETIEGRVTQGSINLDGKSSMRRSCSLTVASSLETNLEDSVNWSLNTKIKIEIGLENQIDSTYPEVIWFNMGYYVLSNFSYNKTATNYTIQLQGKDKMCLLNGTVSGEIYASVDFGMESLLNKKTGESRLVEIPVQDIIYEGVREYAREPYRNIIIKDLPQQGLNLLQWNNSNNLYVIRSVDTQVSTEAENALVNRTVYWQNNGTVVKTTFDDLVNEPDFHWSSLNNLGAIEPEETSIITLDNTSGAKEYYVAKIIYGQTIGFEPDYLIYPHGEDDSGLTVGPGGVFTEILDKIVNFLGDYEYFYNVDGQFVFQKKRENLDLIWNGNIGVNDVGMGNDYFLTSDVPISWNFNGEEVVTTISDTPNIGNIKNDYSVWGNRTTENGEVPIHFRYAIDHKPEYYNSIYMSGEEIKAYVDKHPEFKDSFTHSTVNGEEVYDDIESINYYTSVSPYPVPNMESYMVDWREIIYQMAKDYLRFKHFDEFHARLAAANIVNGTTHLYPQGITGYEQYYVDIEGGWRSLYRPTEYEDSVIEFKSVVKDEGDYNPNVPIYLKDDWKFWNPAEYDPLNNDYQVLSYNNTPSTNGALPVLFKDPYRVMLRAYLGYDYYSSVWQSKDTEEYFRDFNKIDISLGNGEEPWQYIKKGVFGHNSELTGLDTTLTNELGVGVQTENTNGILSTLKYENGSYIPETTVPFSTVLDDPTKYHILFTNDYNLIIPMNTTLYDTYEEAKQFYSPSDFYCVQQIKNYETIEDQDTTSNGYKVGDKCCYGNHYYKCKKEVAKGAVWNGAYWENYSRTYDIEYYIAETYPDDIEGINHPDVSLIRVNITSSGLQYYDSAENRERGFYGSVYRVGLTASVVTSNKVLLDGKNSVIISRVSTIDSVQGKGAKSYVTFNWNSNNNMIIKNIFSDGIMGDINSQGTYTDKYINTEHCKVVENISGPIFERSKVQLTTPSKYGEGSWTHMNIFYKQNWGHYQYNLSNSYYIARMSSFSGTPVYSAQGGVIIDEETIPYCQESTLFKPFEVNGVVSNWNEYIQTNPEKLNFWFDFLESETDSQIGKYGANKIQQRSKATSDDKAGAIVYLDTLNIAWMFSSDDAEQNAKQDQLSHYLLDAEQTLMNIPEYFKDSFVYSAKAKSCKDIINQWLFDYTWAQETLNFSALPIYSLQPNDLITINNGIQRINTISIPLTFNGTMSVGCSKIVDQNNYSMPGAGDIVPPTPEPEPEPESEWLYHIENIDCNYTPSMDRYRSIQPENINYLQQQIQPFSYENRDRDWVIEVNAEPTTTSNLTLVVLNYTDDDDDYYDAEIYPEISGNRIGGPMANLELRQGSRGNTLGIQSSGSGITTQFEPYGENDRFNDYFPIDGGPANKKITFIKEGDRLQVYVEDELLTTLRVKTPYTSKCRIGTIMKTQNSGFVGNLNYYRFKFTSDFDPNNFEETDIEGVSQEMRTPDFTTTPIAYEYTETDDYTYTQIENRMDYYTTWQQYSDGCKIWKIEHDPPKEYYIMKNTNANFNGKAQPVVGTWKDIQSHLISEDTDGFGIEFQPNDVPNLMAFVEFSDESSNFYGSERNNISQNSQTHNDPTVFDAGNSNEVSTVKGMRLNYVNGSTVASYNSFTLGGNPSITGVFTKDYPVKVIQFKKYKQLIAFTGNRQLKMNSGEAKQNLPSVDEMSDDYNFFGKGINTTASVAANGGCLFRLFTIKYKED